MRKTRRASSPPVPAELGFGEHAYALLGSRIEEALKLARSRGRRVVAAITVSLPGSIDPIAHVEAARQLKDPWSAFAQPARGDFTLATLDAVAGVITEGPERFEQVAASCGQALEAALIDDLFDDPGAPAGSGIVWVGGFSFLDAHPAADIWREFPGATFALPRFSLHRTARERGGADGRIRARAAGRTVV